MDLFLILASLVFGCFVTLCIYMDYSTGRPVRALVKVLGLLGISFLAGIGLRGFRKWARLTATVLVGLLLLALGIVSTKGIQDLNSLLLPVHAQ